MPVALLTALLLAAPPPCPTPFEGPVAWERLEAYLRTQRFDDPSMLLRCLPASYRKHFTLVYESRSPERDAVSMQHPRIVLFGEDAKLVLALTGNPRAAHYDRVQVLAFDEAADRYRLFELTFRPGEVARIEAEPASCVQCHGADPRPLWETYNLWPGV
ncbi:MAG: hypothetical protein ACK4N5_16505, partial [Myxococcales bacterium]